MRASCGRPKIKVIMLASAVKRLHDTITEYHLVYRITCGSGALIGAYLTNMNDTIIALLRALFTRNLETETEHGA